VEQHAAGPWVRGKPLPRAVAASGDGYTLSGKPLDPNSSAARQYGMGGGGGTRIVCTQLEPAVASMYLLPQHKFPTYKMLKLRPCTCPLLLS
jgi:hypothetical protein